ncbi:TetR/AcrR family transcriptional regulator [Chitinimonas sp.]|uniref:TetR/AcrR family transcriptional regulator n=1 Tax=Chitinimonas sp. TaxID=1934313 RepID=UPI002F945976
MTARAFDDTREHLLATGESIMLGKGFSAVGLTEILSSAQVPKGSFYHYFSSKEGYGVALLQRYFAEYRVRLEQLLKDSSLTAREKLDRYFDNWHIEGQPCDAQRCLVVKLTGEVSDLSAAMRQELQQGMEGITRYMAHCIREGRQDGSIPAGQDADALALALYQLWLGAALVTKVQHTEAAYAAARLTTQTLLGTSSA